MFRFCMSIPNQVFHLNLNLKNNENDDDNNNAFVHVDHPPSSQAKPSLPSVPAVPMLVEIVGATNLRAAVATKTGRRKSMVHQNPDTHCVVRLSPTIGEDDNNSSNKATKENTIAHKTNVITRDENPIWTVKSKSLCILQIPDYTKQYSTPTSEPVDSTTTEEEEEEDSAKHSSCAQQPETPSPPQAVAGEEENKASKKCVVFEVCHGKNCLGKVEVGFDHILQCQGEREEFPIVVCGDNDDADHNEERPVADDNNNQANRALPALVELEKQQQRQQQSMLALRFRPAETEDIEFMNELEQRQNRTSLMSTCVSSARSLRSSIATVASPLKASSSPLSAALEIGHDDEAMDVNFRKVVLKSLFTSYKKKDERTGETLYRLQPPKRDPLLSLDNDTDQHNNNEPVVEWMTKAQIQQETYDPSWKWVETGDGDAGTLYLEIIGCDNLPDLDVTVTPGTENLSDPFVAVAFEDVFVRTNVIFDTLHPRWMPWATRAFAFSISHPGSDLFVGVFDHDEDMAKHFHDPIGRVVVNTMNFESGMTYLLHYNLVHSAQIDTPRGTITMRLRVEWKDENKAAKLALTTPPLFIINVETQKAWHVLHYTLYGGINQDKASIASVKLYMNEFFSYWNHYCYFLDVVAGILLWRGRTHLSFLGCSINIWFPVHSIWLFASVSVAYERPYLAPSISFFGLAWIMISLNYYHSRHPYPWYQVKTFESLVMGLITGPTSHVSTIEANTAVAEKSHFDTLGKLKADRMSAFISAFISTGLKAYRIYSGTNLSNVVDTTEDPSWYFLSGKLYYPHMALKYFCKTSRDFRNFIGWKSYGSFQTTLNLLFWGTLCLIPPLHLVASWTMRILIWTFLGPLMKLVDIVFVHKYYKTNEELLDDVVNGREDQEYSFQPLFDAIIEHDIFHSMRKSGRVVAEDATKLKDMRGSLQGTWSEKVPLVDNSRNFSYPLPQSSAKPWSSDHMALPRRLMWKFAPSGRLHGSMIMRRKVQPPSSRNFADVDKSPESKKEQ